MENGNLGVLMKMLFHQQRRNHSVPNRKKQGTVLNGVTKVIFDRYLSELDTLTEEHPE